MFKIFGIDLLTLLIALPAVSALLVANLPDNKTVIRWVALILSLISGALAVTVFFTYRQASPEILTTINAPWFPPIKASWHLGIDGISAAMILLTGILV